MTRLAALASLALAPGLATAAPVEVKVTPSLSSLAAPVSCMDFEEVRVWAGTRGYRFPLGEGLCSGRAVVAVSWTAAAVWANALSERSGLVPAYRDEAGMVARDADRLDVVPVRAVEADGYRLPTLVELGFPPVRSRMTRAQEWTDTSIDLGDGVRRFYLCRPGACDFHSPRTSGRGVAFRLVRRVGSGSHVLGARQPFAVVGASMSAQRRCER